MALGLDLGDFAAAMAPKPVALLGQEKDFFDARGLEEAHGRLQRLDELLGAPENLSLDISPDFHSSPPPSRRSIVRFFNHATGGDTGVREPSLTLEKAADLLCTPDGQVSAIGSKGIPDFVRDKAEQIARSRPALSGEDLKAAVRKGSCA